LSLVTQIWMPAWFCGNVEAWWFGLLIVLMNLITSLLSSTIEILVLALQLFQQMSLRNFIGRSQFLE